MKNNLLELLMNFFEQRLSQLADGQLQHDNSADSLALADDLKTTSQLLVIQRAHKQSVRVFTQDEQTKFTKASYQFIMRLLVWQLIKPHHMELVLSQLACSESAFIDLNETKATIHSVLAECVDTNTLMIFDTVLYHEEDELTQH